MPKDVKSKRKKKKSSSVEKTQTGVNIMKMILYGVLIVSAFISVWILLMVAGIVPSLEELIEQWQEAAQNLGNSTVTIPEGLTGVS